MKFEMKDDEYNNSPKIKSIDSNEMKSTQIIINTKRDNEKVNEKLNHSINGENSFKEKNSEYSKSNKSSSEVSYLDLNAEEEKSNSQETEDKINNADNINKNLNQSKINGPLIKNEEGENIAKEYKIDFFEISNKQNINVQEAGLAITNKVIEKREKEGSEGSSPAYTTSSKLSKKLAQKNVKKSCC